jgi:hypothetical protein
MPQLTYNNAPAKGFAGQIADLGPRYVVSRLNGEASANLPFGIGVQKGATDSECLLPSATGQLIEGVTVRETYIDSSSLATNGAIAPDAMAAIMKKGAIYVLPEQNVVKGDPVYCRHTVNGALTPGRFRKDADTAKADLLAGAMWGESGSADQPTKLILNLP